MERVTEFVQGQAAYAAGDAVQQLPTVQEAANSWLR
jgi:hypothetical protein